MSAPTNLGGDLHLPRNFPHRPSHGLRRDAARRPARLRPTKRSRMPPSPSCAKPSPAGVDHIDTSDFYGPHITNQIIKEALHPYPRNLTIVTKVGAKRGNDGSWIMDHLGRRSCANPSKTTFATSGLDTLAIVNLRVGGVAAPNDASIAEPLDCPRQAPIRGTHSAHWPQHNLRRSNSTKPVRSQRSSASRTCTT